jgi:hypothetical protein
MSLHDSQPGRPVRAPMPSSVRLDVPDTPIPSKADVTLSVRSSNGSLLLRATVDQGTRRDLEADGTPADSIWPPVLIDEHGARELARVCLRWLRARGRLG